MQTDYYSIKSSKEQCLLCHLTQKIVFKFSSFYDFLKFFSYWTLTIIENSNCCVHYGKMHIKMLVQSLATRKMKELWMFIRWILSFWPKMVNIEHFISFTPVAVTFVLLHLSLSSLRNILVWLLGYNFYHGKINIYFRKFPVAISRKMAVSSNLRCF